jgi:SAM-dependent methyltransferase
MDISEYFAGVWKPNIDQFIYSGWRLLGKITPGQTVLDIGCGYNLFKPYLEDDLIGIDPYNVCADIQISVEEFETHQQFDVVLCLGSINFGPETVIEPQVKKAVALCKTGGKLYWRQNPGVKDHPHPECKYIDFYDWSFEKNLEFAKKYNCRVEILAWDGPRIYAEWTKC